MVAGSLAAAGLAAAPSAGASCFSIFGLGNSAECHSTILSAAIAIGPNATAFADGLLGAAISLGADTTASTGDAFSVATSLGPGSRSSTFGLFSIATAIGGSAATFGAQDLGNVGFNIALNIAGPGNRETNGVLATGFGNIAANLGGGGDAIPGSSVITAGILNTAVVVGGKNNTVTVNGPDVDPAYLSSAFALFSSNKVVQAGPGPIAIAGSIFQNGGADVTKEGPGFNINGFRVGGAAATRKARPVAAATQTPSKTRIKTTGAATAKPAAGRATR